MRSNFVAIVGEANAGKSTLLNNIVGEKVSIVSPKAQTTRSNIRGIKEIDDVQIVFIDTPGFCRTKSNLNKILDKNAKSAYLDADTILVIIDASSKSNDGIFKFLKNIKTMHNRATVIIAINKVDIVKKESILSISAELVEFDFVKNVFMISAKNGDGVGDLERFLVSTSKSGPWHYQEKCVTDMPMNFRLAEITREKIFLLLRQELPYNVYVETEFFKESGSKVIINQVVVASKYNHKMIIIGEGSSMIKKIKNLAIIDMKKIFTLKNITLKLFVKIEKDWDSKKEHLRSAYLV